MPCAKISISLEKRTLRGLDALIKRAGFRSRSEAIENAVAEQLSRHDRSRLARECAKLVPAEEQAMAEEGIALDAEAWPEY